jgi:Domain of unknown function (DUF5753)/Helix-turn-helix domain
MADHIATVRQRRLARALRETPRKAGLTQEEVAARMEWHSSKLFRLENARSSRVDWLDVRELLDMYGVPSPDRETLVQLAKDARERGWWTSYQDVFTGSYVALEDASPVISTYCSELVHGLLQSPGYAREVIRSAWPGCDEQCVERRAAARLARQQAVLGRNAPPDLVCVLNEAVLRRRIGGPRVMREQLQALSDAARRPNVTIRVLPFTAGAHAGLAGSFVVLEFTDSHDANVAYVEGAAADLCMDSTAEVMRYKRAFERIAALALGPVETTAMIAAAIKHVH